MQESTQIRRGSRLPSPGSTGHEQQYLKHLAEKKCTVQLKLRNGECVRGWIEYFDKKMIRLTREGKPNLFLYKHGILTLADISRKRTGGGNSTGGNDDRH